MGGGRGAGRCPWWPACMRKEVYPVRYLLNDTGIRRLEADRVVKAEGARAGTCC